MTCGPVRREYVDLMVFFLLSHCFCFFIPLSAQFCRSRTAIITSPQNWSLCYRSSVSCSVSDDDNAMCSSSKGTIEDTDSCTLYSFKLLWLGQGSVKKNWKRFLLFLSLPLHDCAQTTSRQVDNHWQELERGRWLSDLITRTHRYRL